MAASYDPSRYGANIATQQQLQASGPGGFNLTFNRSAGGGGQPPPSPSAPAGMGGFGASRGLDSSVASGQYRNPFDLTAAQNAAMSQSRSLRGQQDLARQSQSHQMAMQQAAFGHQQQLQDNILGQLSANVGTWGTNAPPMPRIQVQQLPFQSGVPQVGRIEAPDLTAAQNASFARAKDREGQMATGALTGLRSQLGGRGLLGSGAELRGTANIANRGLANLGEVNREQAIQGGNAAVQQAQLGYQGAITQRGQDIQQAQNMNNTNLDLARMQFQADLAEREGVMQHNQQGQQFMQNLLLGLMRAY